MNTVDLFQGEIKCWSLLCQKCRTVDENLVDDFAHNRITNRYEYNARLGKRVVQCLVCDVIFRLLLSSFQHPTTSSTSGCVYAVIRSEVVQTKPGRPLAGTTSPGLRLLLFSNSAGSLMMDLLVNPSQGLGAHEVWGRHEKRVSPWNGPDVFRVLAVFIGPVYFIGKRNQRCLLIFCNNAEV